MFFGNTTNIISNPTAEASEELENLQVGNVVYNIPTDFDAVTNKPTINGETMVGGQNIEVGTIRLEAEHNNLNSLCIILKEI